MKGLMRKPRSMPSNGELTETKDQLEKRRTRRQCSDKLMASRSKRAENLSTFLSHRSQKIPSA